VGAPKLSLPPGAGNPRYAIGRSVVCTVQRHKDENKIALSTKSSTEQNFEDGVHYNETQKIYQISEGFCHG